MQNDTKNRHNPICLIKQMSLEGTTLWTKHHCYPKNSNRRASMLSRGGA
jgi:hypothetical protein